MPTKKTPTGKASEKEPKAAAEKKTTKASGATKRAAATKPVEEKATTSGAKKAVASKAAASKTVSASGSAPKKSVKKAAEPAEEKKTAAKASTGRTTRASAATRKAASAKSKVAEPAVEPAVDEVRVVNEEQIVAQAPTDVREQFVEAMHAPIPEAPMAELPPEYGDTKVVLLVRDPEWVFAYWELSEETRARYGVPREGFHKRLVLRVYNVTGRKWPEDKAQYCFDIDVGPYANNWYIRVPESDASWVAELGVIEEDGTYVPIVASNVAHVPRQAMSAEMDEQWMVIEETFRKIYESSGGFRLHDGWRGSEELWRHIQKHVYPALAGGAQLGGSALMGSGGVAAMKQPQEQSGFWLVADTELILYGATEPTARVTVNEEEVALRPDGSFTQRYALPDGGLKLVIRAESADGKHERIITKEVHKQTR
jgi:hypothetical protein